MDAANSAGWVGLRLDPLDPLFFRGGRPFDAATRVESGLPNPQTLAGALRTALLSRTGFRFRDFAEYRKGKGEAVEDIRPALAAHGAKDWVVQARFRGPWLGLVREERRVEPLLPLPAGLTKAKKATNEDWRWSRAAPLEGLELPGWRNKDGSLPDGLLPLWRWEEADPKAEGGWLTLCGLKNFLGGKDDPPKKEFFKVNELYDFDNRIGIGIDKDTLTSAEGDLYGIRLLSLKPKVDKRSGIDDDPYPEAQLCLYAEIQSGPSPDAGPWFDETPVPFGGEGKYVRAKEIDACDWPKPDPSRKRSLWYLATPSFLLREESKRPLPDVSGLRAAASGPGIAVSGWDVARNGPRPTRFAVPAGAVYFLDGPGAEEGFINGCGGQTADELGAEGWGFALQGVW
jgi:CRISPR-associated protein Cmr3